MTDSLIAIVPAAGIGQRASRAGESPLPKQYRLLAGQPMLRLAVQALLVDVRVGQVYVAVAPDDKWAAEALAGLPRTVCRPSGGVTRANTVAAALADCGAADTDWVLVHDAARPGLPADALGRLIDACLADPVGGLLALPVADTVKSQASTSLSSGGPAMEKADAAAQRRDAGQGAQTHQRQISPCAPGGDPLGGPTRGHVAMPGSDPRVHATLDRNGLWLAQTPQMFRAGLLRAALTRAQAGGVSVTDEASAIEAAGHAPLLVPGSLRNFKVTWPDDFELMEKWL